VNADAENAGGAWHYCAGLVYMSRAAIEVVPEKKQYVLNMAMREINFSALKIQPSHRMFGEIHLNLAKVKFSLDQKDESERLLNKLIQTQPEYIPARIELARQFAKRSKTHEAIDLLSKIDEKYKSNSADLNYALGVYLLRVGKYEESYYHAKKAYALNYPLPWLKMQLKKKGFKF
jgi:tetratricopeptide (TPR) repeat protein